MKLGFDIDGITCDMGNALLEFMNTKYNLNHNINIFKNHGIHENKYVDDPELNEQIALDMRESIIENSEAIVDLETIEEAVVALRKFSKSGHTIHHITSRPDNQYDATVDWLRKNSIPFDSLHVMGISGPQGAKHMSKGRLGRSLNLDFYMDDCPWHLDDMYRYKNRWRKGLGLFTQPWNIEEPFDASRYIRFDDWNEVIRHLGIHKR